MTEPVPERPVEPALPPKPDDLTTVRHLILAAHQDIVPELIHGESIAALVASIDTARAAYTHVVESIPPPATAITIPAGGNAPVPPDIDALPTAEKIRRGLSSTIKRRDTAW